ncbi:DExH-box ATP-dependent RNA helicase DExH7, chloroplastic isoform X3 [Nymphaea colorata]|uniref:DExH-box ATP-dependent RNA helicase DExH7, chloroplastic isoform X3 n=1 Tax=Nymphaea colorata TaxID=210225 RepID=UPI00214E8F9E|nr:DExH-box ATP-dependent RNA helicase DExH7, chloroplastic isoform X3 [Nymphaea colorata]
MAPKHQKKSATAKPSQSGKQKGRSGGGAPKVELSAENERRIRQLLLNSGRSSLPSSATPGQPSMSKAQKAKKLRAIYDQLSCEGFRPEQIESALSALEDGATFEAALDWLCLNIPGNELPLKFSSGTSTSSCLEGSVNVVSMAQADWVPSCRSVEAEEAEALLVPVRVRGRESDDDDGLLQVSQADWIRHYVQQQEEEEYQHLADYDQHSGLAILGDDGRKDANNGDTLVQVIDPRSRSESIVNELQKARLQALEAKKKGDKETQELAGQLIRKLRHEMSSLGISYEANARNEDTITSNVESNSYAPDPHTVAMPEEILEDPALSDLSQPQQDSFSYGYEKIVCGMENQENAAVSSEIAISEKDVSVEVDPQDGDLCSLFSDDTSSSGIFVPGDLELLNRESNWRSGKLSTRTADVLKRGDIGKTPKALLHQQCQKIGWEAPKYSKISAKENMYCYNVSVLRKATGRGKNRKVGGLITFNFPDQDRGFDSVEDAQNAVAAFALYSLFPEIPFFQFFSEPYSSFVLQWLQGKGSNKLEDEKKRRDGFVNSLLGEVALSSSSPAVDADLSFDEASLRQPDHTTAQPYAEILKSHEGNPNRQIYSSLLKNRFEKKRKDFKYQKMLESRASLPIAELRGRFLHLLNENDVVVVCGETGCGKTTQIPQFILEEMIESGTGGSCNIICTQPRRIAAISVAERVSTELCEPLPGSNDSLVGYQVRLENAWNEKTKLLFCTTGILLRKLNGDKFLSDVTHVIVDEVHERSLLGDFLLIVLKDLIKKPSCRSSSKLKVILMSATADASLFSKYFGCCPIITAEGRLHHVTTYFLEDIYESLNYHLPSDSPASISGDAYQRKEFGSKARELLKGRKNTQLSSWGDETILAESYINPHYHENLYEAYSERTRQNLKNLNEDVVDFDVLEELVYHIDEGYPDGAILIFLPGLTEINMLFDKLAASYHFGGLSSDWIFPLHSTLSSTDQQRVFLCPPDGIRKVIIATDIAETSITIDDVVYVVDCGKHKEMRFNPKRKMSNMVEEWISQASAKQRSGRAGRVKPGVCFRLYTRYRFEECMRKFQVPEILRMSLVELCLQIKSLSLGDTKMFLEKAMEPPHEAAVSSAIAMLYEMMLYGSIFGCLSPILSISAFFSYKQPFLYHRDEKLNVEKAKISLVADQRDYNNDLDMGYKHSDHLVLAVAYDKWINILTEKGEKAAQNFCKASFLSSSVMYTIRDMRVQFASLLAEIGFINLPRTDGRVKKKLDIWLNDLSQPFNLYSRHSSVVKSILCAGLYPNIAATEEGMTAVPCGSIQKSSFSSSAKDQLQWYDGEREVYIHPSSINANARGFQFPFLVFLEKVETSKVFLRDTSVVSPYSIMLFGGSVCIQHQAGSVTVDGWLKLSATAQIGVLLKELRYTLDSVMKELIYKPEKAGNIVQNEVVKSIVHLLLEENKQLKS